MDKGSRSFTNPIPNFVPGEIYRRSKLHQLYSGQQQGGISTPANHNFILLFTGETGEQYGYSDGWKEDGIFLYSGEGQSGNMTFTRGNLAIRDHQENHKDLHLFQYIRSAYVRYIDQMVCIGIKELPGIDSKGGQRKTIIFELTSARFADEPVDNAEILSSESLVNEQDLNELKQRILNKSVQSNSPVERKTQYYRRSQLIKFYALSRAKGVCEGCGNPAPFYTTMGQPFLEVHHIHRLSDGGPDHPEAVVAICPNCHRRAHYASDAKDFNARLAQTAKRLENNS